MELIQYENVFNEFHLITTLNGINIERGVYDLIYLYASISDEYTLFELKNAVYEAKGEFILLENDKKIITEYIYSNNIKIKPFSGEHKTNGEIKLTRARRYANYNITIYSHISIGKINNGEETNYYHNIITDDDDIDFKYTDMEIYIQDTFTLKSDNTILQIIDIQKNETNDGGENITYYTIKDDNTINDENVNNIKNMSLDKFYNMINNNELQVKYSLYSKYYNDNGRYNK